MVCIYLYLQNPKKASRDCCAPLLNHYNTYTSLLSSDIAVVEMTDAFRQPSLFYHLGVRESFSMANNIILYCDTNSDALQSLQVSRHHEQKPIYADIFVPQSSSGFFVKNTLSTGSITAENLKILYPKSQFRQSFQKPS